MNTILRSSLNLEVIINKIPATTAPSAQLLVEFSDEDLLKGIKNDLLLAGQLKDSLAAMDRALIFLHEQKVITLQNGLAVFRQAMTIKLEPTRRRYTKGDYQPLEHHYGERIFQIHVMHEYARRGLEKITRAFKLVTGYFTLDKTDFIARFFPGKDYRAEMRYLLENYRSSAHIIAAADQLIKPATGRMKAEHPIRVNRTRQEDAPGAMSR